MRTYGGHLIFILNYTHGIFTVQTHSLWYFGGLCGFLSIVPESQEMCFALIALKMFLFSSVSTGLDHDVQEGAVSSLCMGFGELCEYVNLCLLPTLGSYLPLTLDILT